MARPLPQIEGSLAEELFNHFVDFVKAKGGIPIERAFWGWLIRNHYYTAEQLPEWTFRYQFGRLVTEGWIRVDQETRTLIPLKDVRVVVED